MNMGAYVKAISCTKYGSPDVLQLKEVENPVVGDYDVCVRIFATTVSSGDVRVRVGSHKTLPFWPITRMALGVTKPRKAILGFDFSGRVEAIGKHVKEFSKGESVFGFNNFGAHAEFICLSENSTLAKKPNNMNYEAAAAVPFGALSAFSMLKKANIQKGHKILIYGASGSLGTFAVQIAKYFGAHVTGVCGSKNGELIRSLGADRTIDYTKEDFTKEQQSYDIVFDTLGKIPFSHCKAVLHNHGVFLLAVFSYRQIFQALWNSIIASQKKIICASTVDSQENLIFLSKLIEAGRLVSVIDRCYPWEKVVEAHQYVEIGHKIGNVVLILNKEIPSA